MFLSKQMSKDPNGVVVVNKPSGPTSHDIVAQARRLFGTRAVGHAGTLDPMASGVLLLLLGEATKLSSALVLERKSYRATIRFGMATDSDDALGVPEATAPVVPGWLTRDRLELALECERQRIEQLPPAVSAIKQGGVPAYRRQRRGESITLAPRSVRVFDLSLLAASDETLELSLSVSKGYYVRALARDIGARLAMPSHLSALCRTSSGCFDLREAADWPRASQPNLLTLAEVVRRSMPTRVLLAQGVRRARLGQQLFSEDFADPLPAPTTNCSLACEEANAEPLRVGTAAAVLDQAGPLYAWLDETGSLVALGRSAADGTSRVVRGFNATHEIEG